MLVCAKNIGKIFKKEREKIYPQIDDKSREEALTFLGVFFISCLDKQVQMSNPDALFEVLEILINISYGMQQNIVILNEHGLFPILKCCLRFQDKILFLNVFLVYYCNVVFLVPNHPKQCWL